MKEEEEEGLHPAVQKHIPNTTTRSKNNKPWVDYTTQKMIRRRDRPYGKRWRKSGDEDLCSQVKNLKRQIQHRLRRALYWSHTENMITRGSNPQAMKRVTMGGSVHVHVEAKSAVRGARYEKAPCTVHDQHFKLKCG